MNKLKFYSLVTLIGALNGLFLLYPVHEILFYIDRMRFMHGSKGLVPFLEEELNFLLNGENLIVPSFYCLLGITLALISAKMYRSATKHKLFVQQVADELGKSIEQLIAQGEGPLIEFKSTLRWDVQHTKVNKALETVILKTLSGFMNSGGGTLLIGVSDELEILGLEDDYKSLKKKNRDGFELTLMTLVSNNLGTDLCRQVHILFHEIDGKDVCRVIISGAPRPVYLKHENKLKLFVRAGGSTRDLNLQEAVQYISDNWKKA